MTAPEKLSPANRRAALVVSRLMFYAGIMLGLLLGAGAVILLFTDKIALATQDDRLLTGGVFGGLAILALCFSAVGRVLVKRHYGAG